MLLYLLVLEVGSFFDFKRKKNAFHFSIQDVRVWGQDGNSPAVGSLSVFETYASFKLGNYWWIKLGRQAVELDNGRLFSKSNRSQFSRAHDGIRFNFEKKAIRSDFMFFYNQKQAANFGNSYPSNFYKFLATHYFVYTLSKKWNVKLLNSFDGFQHSPTSKKVFVRGTSGGRITYQTKKIGATIAGYYQYGRYVTGHSIYAFYLQPEINAKIKKLKFRLGMEVVSGGVKPFPNAYSIYNAYHSFSSLYGVAFKFMGNLNYFTSFPNDLFGAGLVNPYFFITYKVSPKFRLKLESHLFYTQQNLDAFFYQKEPSYLGFESDFKLKYELNKETFFDFGFSVMAPTKSMALFKSGDYTKTPIYTHLTFTWRPTLFHAEQTIH